MTTATIDPGMTQRMTALASANSIRMERAEYKRRLAAGQVTFTDLLWDLPDCLDTCPVYELLRSVPKLGPTKASRVLGDVTFSENRKLGTLTIRERHMLVASLRENAAWVVG
jgi:hypothetical protein